MEHSKEELRLAESTLHEQFYEACERLMELDADLLKMHNILHGAGEQAREILYRADVVAASKQVLERRAHQQRIPVHAAEKLANKAARKLSPTYTLKRSR